MLNPVSSTPGGKISGTKNVPFSENQIHGINLEQNENVWNYYSKNGNTLATLCPPG